MKKKLLISIYVQIMNNFIMLHFFAEQSMKNMFTWHQHIDDSSWQHNDDHE